jgi:hypothetical protein
MLKWHRLLRKAIVVRLCYNILELLFAPTDLNYAIPDHWRGGFYWIASG